MLISLPAINFRVHDISNQSDTVSQVMRRHGFHAGSSCGIYRRDSLIVQRLPERILEPVTLVSHEALVDFHLVAGSV